jgi:hypothetical protein
MPAFRWVLPVALVWVASSGGCGGDAKRAPITPDDDPATGAGLGQDTDLTGDAGAHQQARAAGGADDEGSDGDGDDASSAGEPGPLGLSVEVTERGPGMPWVLSITNDGDAPVRMVADPRLLQFEILVPHKRQPVTCKLPSGLFPDGPDRRLEVQLEPGEGVAEAFDPRLYCFAAGGQDNLVPGAIVTPSFGWPPKKPRSVWRSGKKEEVAAEQAPPFLAGPAGGEQALPLADPPPKQKELDGGAFEEARVKRLQAKPFALRSEYAKWSSTRIADEVRKNPGPFDLDLVQGSDAHAERTATIDLSLKNRSKQSQQVFFRRELVSFEVTGPDGMTTCDAQPDVRNPDPQGFTSLRPGGAVRVATRLTEVCPRGTFSRPGLYLVHARFDATVSGEQHGLDAYTGTAVSTQPAGVRIRTGEQPFLQKRVMRRFGTSAADPAAAATAPPADAAGTGAGADAGK